MTSTHIGIIKCVVLLFAIITNDLASNCEARGRKLKQGRVSRRQQPWQINEDVCPPSLCGPQAMASVGFQPSVVQSLNKPAHFPFFEGDIVLDSDLRSKMGRGKRAVIRPISHLWQYGMVPYRIDSSFDGTTKRVIRKAIEVYMNETCVQFARRNSERDYIHFVNEPGCWSYVGKRSIGAQKIGVGEGCRQLGTVLHELGHALGFWHEQSRADRDNFIEIVESNIAVRYLDQFGKRLPNETTSRGFPYDYRSIMHYGNKDFSANGRPTLKGVGEELDLNIGQRNRLSDIDKAQIKDIYYCNQRHARDKGTACDSGWEKFNGHCYKFVTDTGLYFKAAVEYCNQQDSHLLHIESESEDDFIKDHLISHYSEETTWWAGAKGRRRNYYWFDGRKGFENKDMSYTAWAPSFPWKYTAMTLERYDGTPPRFVWRATWAGNEKTVDSYRFPFICEKPTQSTKCFQSPSGTGSEYRGYVSYTSDYITCQRWTEQYPHQHSTMTGQKSRDEILGLGGHNYCRNPDGLRERPWCYTTKKDIEWQYCDVFLC